MRENNCATEDERDDIPHPIQKYHTELNKLSSDETIAFGMGICQLLEEYGKTNLKSQYIATFPTTVLESVNLLLDKLIEKMTGNGKRKA